MTEIMVGFWKCVMKRNLKHHKVEIYRFKGGGRLKFYSLFFVRINKTTWSHFTLGRKAYLQAISWLFIYFGRLNPLETNIVIVF